MSLFSRLTGLWARSPSFAEHEWRHAIAALPQFAGFSESELDVLRALAQKFLKDKAIEPVGGLQLTTDMLLRIALLACLPILKLDLSYYRNWYAVVVYPSGFVAEHEYIADDGTVHVEHGPLAGEAWERGPVIVSWEDIEAATTLDGFNVVIHEFAHKLDMLQGSCNGLPPLHKGMTVDAWSTAFSRAFDDFNLRVDTEEDLPIDAYAAESPAEFFAVLSEAFFEIPDALLRLYPAVYAQLSLFYRQDPAVRLSPQRHSSLSSGHGL
ncbi:zinc-dependent peptidase [Alkalilimnicola ehrlichii]|uniref:M90 family metallopeptidase n=1 Tax=Alkalilimnicola ehrlichii TaxID=351052 RepID=UPI0021619D72|nr:M90 family metallopeptidase [Alkalilimnicola ehrlichii]